jgi:protein TonB
LKHLRIALAAVLFALTPRASFGATESHARLRVLYKVYPEYPYAARDRHLEGKGLLQLNLQSDGTVRSLSILKSTGHAILDDAAVAAFRQWRFTPGITDHIKMPFFFTMTGVRYRMENGRPLLVR